MKFKPTIDLWTPGVIDSLHNGSLRLQPGQWVRCGNSRSSRFAGCTLRTIVASHPQRGGTVPLDYFRAHRAYALSIGSY